MTLNSNNSTRWWLVFFDGAKAHYVPDPLKEGLIKNMSDRGCEVTANEAFQTKEVSKVCLDAGGMCCLDDTILELQMPGAICSVAANQVDYFLNQIENLQERRDFGMPFYKAHGRFHCVCLLPEHHGNLIDKMKIKLIEAKAITEVENLRFNERLDRINSKHVMVSQRTTGSIEDA